MKRVFAYLKPYFRRMSVGLFIKFLGTIMDLMLPWLLAFIIDEVVPDQDISKVVLYGGVMFACAIVAIIANVVANRMAARVARDTIRNIRHDLFKKSINLSCEQVDNITIPSLESRLTTDTYNLHQMIGMMQRMGVRAPILLIGGILITFSMEPMLTLILMSVLPIAAILIYQISRRGIPLFARVQKSIDSMVSVIRENISGIRIVKALSKTDYEKKRFSKVNDAVVSNEKRANYIMAITNPSMSLLLNFGLTCVILLGAYRVNAGVTQPGKIIAFLSYFTIILMAMQFITRIFVIYSKASASADRIDEVLNYEEDLPVIECEKIDTAYHIQFDDVSFSYRDSKETVHNISFAIKRGETLGIIGSTGSGKSTLIHLLMRLYDIEEKEQGNRIWIGGRDIRSIPKEELHTMFGVVFQNDSLFADTIEENIDFGRGLSNEQIEKAMHMAQAEEFISNLEDGLKHILTSRGTNLSGGQRQRILIARALAGSPDILILDDSSSALDYKTDAALRKSIKEEYSDITTVIVAQRISSIMNADHILVLEDGREAGYGTHNELLETCPIYEEIYNSQMGGDSIG